MLFTKRKRDAIDERLDRHHSMISNAERETWRYSRAINERLDRHVDKLNARIDRLLAFLEVEEVHAPEKFVLRLKKVSNNENAAHQ